MKKVVFADSWKPILAESGLVTFDDFFNFFKERLNKSRKRDVQMLTVGEGNNKKVFFMKRVFYPHLKDRFSNLLNFGRACSQAKCEWENANLLISNGIDTYRPVCYGEQTCLGLEIKSFFLTAKVQGQCLTDFVAENWLQMKVKQKEDLMAALAKLIRKVHSAKISLPDLYVWHIYITNRTEAGEYEFAIIDLHRMKQNNTSFNKQIRNLGRFDYSMLEKYFDDNLRRVFIESYADDKDPYSIAELAKKVKKYSDWLSSERTPRKY